MLNFVEVLKINWYQMWTNFKPEDLINLCNKINPTNEKGKITLISRFGADNVSKHLPKLIRAIKKGIKCNLVMRSLSW